MPFLISRHSDRKNIRVKKNLYAKGFEPFCPDSLDSIALTIERFAWSPCRFHDGHRKTTHFADANLLALDFDNGLLPLAQACNVFSDCQHVIGTTFNHQQNKGGIVCDRFRVVLVLDRVVTEAAEYAATAKYYAERYDADLKAVDAARFFWPCPQIVSVNADPDDYRFDVIKPRKDERVAPLRYGQQGVIRRRTQLALRGFVPVGERNTFCFSIAKDLRDAGFGFDDIYARIIASPTYCGGVTYEVERDISDSIRSGIKSVDQGKAYGRRDGSGRGTQKEGAREGQRGEEDRREGATGGVVLECGASDEP